MAGLAEVPGLLEDLPMLEELTLSTRPAGMLDEQLLISTGGLERLTALHVPYASIDDKGVGLLADRFPLLSELGLCMTDATDAALEELARLARLRTLTLCGSQFTEQALLEIEKLKGLSEVSFVATAIERERLQQFADVNVRLRVKWSSALWNTPEAVESSGKSANLEGPR